jgi:hypothetical protein
MMFKSGWIRLWVVATCSLLVVAVVTSAIYVWGYPVSYTFFTISIADEATAQDRTLAESEKKDAITKTFTGGFPYSTVVTLEDLAKRGAVTQVSFQWLEPSGWSEKEHNAIDILNGREIKLSEVIRRVSSYVHRARLRHAAVYIAAVAALSIAVLLLGVGVAWIRRGFAAR